MHNSLFKENTLSKCYINEHVFKSMKKTGKGNKKRNACSAPSSWAVIWIPLLAFLSLFSPILNSCEYSLNFCGWFFPAIYNFCVCLYLHGSHHCHYRPDTHTHTHSLHKLPWISFWVFYHQNKLYIATA